MKTINSKTVVFIPGAFVTANSWDDWKAYFDSQGYKTLVPPWPHKNAPAEVLREHPDPEIASLRLQALTDYYANLVQQLPEKPILIGHSLGGLIVQLLLQRDLGAAGIVIHSVPPRGVIPFELSIFRAGTKSLGLFTSTKKPYLMSLKDWQYAFTNGMPPEQQKAAYEQYAAPESKKLIRDGLTKAARVDFKKQHAPLLFIAGSSDHLMPASVNWRNFKHYKNNDSITEFKEFEGRNHFVLGQPTWKEDAAYISNWINVH
jgi:pimeloyl-ACP methyl ester carboxylesterase